MVATCTHIDTHEIWWQVAPIEIVIATCNQAGMDKSEKYPSALAERFQIRMPEGLRDKIRAAAEKNNRSMNSEIISRLEDTFLPLVERVVQHEDSTLDEGERYDVSKKSFEIRLTKEQVDALFKAAKDEQGS